MTWLAQVDHADSPLEGYFGWRPELLDHFKAFYGALWDEELLEPQLLELLRLRIAQIHGCEAELAVRFDGAGLSDDKLDALSHWRNSDIFDDKDRALLAYAEQIPFAHHAISDESAAEVRSHLGEAGYVAYSIAVSMFDSICRLKMVMAMATTGGNAAAPPASATGVLR